MTGQPKAGGAILLLGVVVLAAVPRFVDLSSDPIAYWPFGTAWEDEGAWNFEAAQAARSGVWPEVQPSFRRMAPFYSSVQGAVFTFMGASIPSARLLSALAGVATALLITRLFQPLGLPTALLAGTLYATNTWTIAIDRHATPESLCIALLVGGLLVMCHPERVKKRHLALGMLLASLASLSKPPAAFGMLAILVFGISRLVEHRTEGGWRRRDLWRLGGIGALALVTGGAALAAVSQSTWFKAAIVHPLTTLYVSPDGDWGAYLGDVLLAWVRVGSVYPFTVYHSIPLVGIGLWLAGPTGGPLPPHAKRLARLALLWLVAWWFVYPFTGFRLLRFAFATVPVTLLGAIGFHVTHERLAARLPVVGKPWVLGVLTGWLLWKWSMWLSDLTGVRARAWVVIQLVALGGLALAAVTTSRCRRVIPEGRPESLVAAAFLTTLLQSAPFVAWIPHHGHLVTAAVTLAAKAKGLASPVCGGEAYTLLFGGPANVSVLYPAWNPHCRGPEGPARTVVFPRELSCQSAATHPRFYEANRDTLLRQPALASVAVPRFDGPRRMICTFSFVAVDDAWWQGARE